MVKRTLFISAVGLLMAGCRTATRVADVPRVDLVLEGGNRGYLIGTPPPPMEQKTSRQMVQTDVEIPSLYQPKPGGGKVLKEVAPPEVDLSEQDAAPAAVEPGPYDTYTVKKNESLWSIAAKPEVYGKATRWRRIYDANRDILKTPDQVRPGMVLKIPRGKTTQQNDEGTALKK
ncbi:MAG: LysM peptidoglycan-binding domain-containing protein [Candidatus Omnitrophica bacterium]|nr:LysM peptidoglycan-binding domain-containing protein [Candidatus Omnitrophota bacterium]